MSKLFIAILLVSSISYFFYRYEQSTPEFHGVKCTEQLLLDSHEDRTTFLCSLENNEISIALDIPKKLKSSNKKLPLLILLSGYFTKHKENLSAFNNKGENVFISLKYPEISTKLALPFLSFKMKRQFLEVRKWISNLKFIDQHKINFLGVSLGSMIGPRLIVESFDSGLPFSSCCFAYGGADLELVLKDSSSKFGLFAFWGIRQTLANFLLYPMNPVKFLPKIAKISEEKKLKTLIINAIEGDEYMPPSSIQVWHKYLIHSDVAVIEDGQGHIKEDKLSTIVELEKNVIKFMGKNKFLSVEHLPEFSS